ncbi:MAG: DNA gyrase inhibitor YacG [bacterium]|nr:DNA gyrase inhibitor YacG [bacterium]
MCPFPSQTDGESEEAPRIGLRCPYCRAPMTIAQKNPTGNPFFPFCSERCKLADLYKWLAGEYAIEQPLDTLTEEQREDLPPPAPEDSSAAG